MFGYNVLFGYAVWAGPLLVVRRWPVRALVVVLVLCAASRPIYNISRVAILGPDRVNAANKERGAAFQAALVVVRDAWLAFAYIGAVLLLVARDRAWIRRLARLAWTGRMALTNYMMEVVLLDSLFTPHGLGITVTPAMVPLGAITLSASILPGGRAARVDPMASMRTDI